jgi:REP element-mobilizing transposase RayT
MEPRIYRGYGALRVGRYSAGHSNYFVTGCLARPPTGLTEPAIADAVRAKLHELEARGLWHLRTYVLMPAHFHLLFTLGESAQLSDALRLFKGPLSPVLRAHHLRWQQNFYDHRLRAEGNLLPTFLYIFLNPHRANLIAADSTWPWYFCAPDDWEWFGGVTNASVPFPEWLK